MTVKDLVKKLLDENLDHLVLFGEERIDESGTPLFLYGEVTTVIKNNDGGNEKVVILGTPPHVHTKYRNVSPY